MRHSPLTLPRLGLILLSIYTTLVQAACIDMNVSTMKMTTRGPSEDRKVFAHYMVGLTYSQTPQKWSTDILQASAAGIDGFALNFGPHDTYTVTQLQHAYAAAEQLPSFSLFLSFDMLAGEWSIPQVVDMINMFKNSPAQFKKEGMPLVSTFEGVRWAGNWGAVRAQVEGGLFLVPSWTSLGPQGLQGKVKQVDGFFSWDAWPQPGERNKTTESDVGYQKVLGDKAFMMGVSPSFFTNLPQWHKNWYSSSETLWLDRWLQVLDVMPSFVQIITWNDFGESHYISDLSPAQTVPGASWYVDHAPHSALRSVLPYFIAAYKAGTPNISPPGGSRAIAWYRPERVEGRTAGDTVWGQGGYLPASEGARDVVSVLVIAEGESVVTLKMGGKEMKFDVGENGGPVDFFSVPYSNGVGDGGDMEVVLGLGGRTVRGVDIRKDGGGNDPVNYNAVVIGVPGDEEV